MAHVDLDDRGILVACTNCGKNNRLAFDKLGVAVRCGQCKQPLAMVNTPVELHATADFDRIVAQSSLPVLVDYWAPWCGPCRMVAPELKKVAARQAGRALVLKVNTDELTDLGQRFGRGFSVDNLENMRRFYLAYKKLGISETPSRKSSRAVTALRNIGAWT